MTTKHPTPSLGGGFRSGRAGLSSGLRTWLRQAAHVCYVFTALWKNRLAAARWRDVLEDEHVDRCGTECLPTTAWGAR